MLIVGTGDGLNRSNLFVLLKSASKWADTRREFSCSPSLDFDDDPLFQVTQLVCKFV